MAACIAVFEKNADVNSLYAREDGNIFFNENYANLDAGKLKIYEVTRQEAMESQKPTAPVTKTPTAPATKNAPTAKKATTTTTKKAVETVDKTTNMEGKNPETRNQETKE